MTTIAFTVSGMPRGKGRGRPVKRGPHLAVINDDATEAYQNRINNAADRAMRGLFGEHYTPMEGPISLRILVRLPVPASATKKRQQAMRDGSELPARRPDADNVSKAVLDALNHVAWRDDVQVTFLWVRKVYADLPGLDVMVGPDTSAALVACAEAAA